MNKIGTWNDFQNDVRKNGCFSAPDSPAQFWFSFPLAQRWDMVLRTFGSNLGRTGLGSAVFFWVVSDKFWNVSLLPSQGMTAFYSKRSLWAIWNMDCMFLQSLPRCDPDLTVNVLPSSFLRQDTSTLTKQITSASKAWWCQARAYRSVHLKHKACPQRDWSQGDHSWPQASASSPRTSVPSHVSWCYRLSQKRHASNKYKFMSALLF